ncbi:class I SAM-dependent methyltransferase [Mesorhizobium sp. PAMC28654]|uniref:class I SAM-dependent methyltransferase n=1 Tax=Mesorhizobium sp. PAMC28654 TaxID=2880934 RepID=UPI001D09FA22|nr:class I SAM-dependent methyltransferase [Mesorhizobium sp. PAMC28654]UDL91624.1 class I SAM-dependent methyltransferase [Mesorhizobium sp. PAMC28654]
MLALLSKLGACRRKIETNTASPLTLLPANPVPPVTVTRTVEILPKDIEVELSQLREALAIAGAPPLPPAHLQRRVVGGYVSDFIRSGDILLADFERILTRSSFSLNDCKSVLDFGVGCGRVLRRFAETRPNHELAGADIDQEAIEWLKANYSRFGNFILLPHTPPCSLPSAYFDLIYSVSVFTHLDLRMQDQWLTELKRASKPGGFLIVTVHGDNYLQQFPPDVQTKAAKDGAFYNENAGLTEGLPDFYKNTYHTKEYIMQHWARFFEIVDYDPMGGANHQDLILMRNS